MSKEENKEQIIIRFLHNEASPDELVWLSNWLKLSDENKQYFRLIKNYYDISHAPVLKVDVNSALHKVNTQINSKNKQNYSIWTVFQRIAAILFLPLVMLSMYFWLKSNDTGAANYCEVRANAGSCLSINLPDSTVVWLKSGSKLRYPDRFLNTKREVYLYGEAYFEVFSSEKKPFIVNTPTIQVVATGTKFSLTDFENNEIKGVSLVEGKVHVNPIDEPNNIIAALKPNQHLDYNVNNKNISIIDGDLYKYFAWKDNKLLFRNDLMIDVIKKISQHYNVEIEIQDDPDIKEYRYRASFSSESLDEVLKLLKLSSPIDYYEIPRIQLKDGSFTKPKIVICKRGSAQK